MKSFDAQEHLLLEFPLTIAPHPTKKKKKTRPKTLNSFEQRLLLISSFPPQYYFNTFFNNFWNPSLFFLMLLCCSHIHQLAFMYYERKEGGGWSTAQVEHVKSGKLRCGYVKSSGGKGVVLRSRFHSITGVSHGTLLIHISSGIAGRTKSGTLN